MKQKFLFGLLLLFFGVFACTKNETSGSSTTVGSLDCSGVTFSDSATAGTAFTGTATVPYTGGNGVAYSAGSAIGSTGVTGLSATLQPGTASASGGNLTYNITGTPSGSGTAVFAISFGGQSCSLYLTVEDSTSIGGNGDTTTTNTDCASATGAAKVVCLANAFLATLSTTQQASVVLTLNLTNAKRWSNLPCGLSCRNGLAFSSLSATQLAAALAVIKAAGGTTSGEGSDEFNTIRAADDYLGTLGSSGGPGGGGGYSSGNYVIAFLGTPSNSGKWMLQYGGHHYAANITYDASKVVSITPLHEGVEPHTSFMVNGKTYASPLATEDSVMSQMLASFSTTELASAKISGTFSDVLMVPGSTTNTFPATKQGIKVSTLSSTAQAKVLAAMQPWINDLDDSSAAVYKAIYQSELADTYVSYASNTSGTSGNSSSFFTSNTDYARIDGPSVWIEFICQNGVVISNQIHFHTVMRDQKRDYIGLQ